VRKQLCERYEGCDTHRFESKTPIMRCVIVNRREKWAAECRIYRSKCAKWAEECTIYRTKYGLVCMKSLMPKRVLIFEGLPLCVCVCVCVCVCLCLCLCLPGCRGGFQKSWHPTVITDAETREDYRRRCKPNCECASNIHMLCAAQNARQSRLSQSSPFWILKYCGMLLSVVV